MAFRVVGALTLLAIGLAAASGPVAAQSYPPTRPLPSDYPAYRPLPPVQADEDDEDVAVIPNGTVPGSGISGPYSLPPPGGIVTPDTRVRPNDDRLGRPVAAYPDYPPGSGPTAVAPPAPGFIYPDDPRRRPVDPNFRPDPRDAVRGAPLPGDDVVRPPAPIGPAAALNPPAPVGNQPAPVGQSLAVAPNPPGVISALPPEEQPEVGEPKELPPNLRRQLVDFQTKEPAGTVVIDTPNTYLYLVLGNGKAMRYGIGVGREGFTWAGTEKISKMAEWPDWFPPSEMIDRQPYLPRMMAGGEGNPLGARALYLGKTLYRIHGTNQPSTIGTFVSSGCVRLVNEDIADLYGRVKVGARVVVLPGSMPPATASANPPLPINPTR
jgi:lipoprotein-anchoring transpeptidase ErfK/SrfK